MLTNVTNGSSISPSAFRNGVYSAYNSGILDLMTLNAKTTTPSKAVFRPWLL